MLSRLTVFFILIMFFTSCSSSLKLHEGFVTNRDSIKNSNSVYIITKDHEKIKGKEMEPTVMMFKRGKVKMDNKMYPIISLKEYEGNGEHYAIINKRPALRIVHGKINVYQVVANVYSEPGRNNLHPFYFIQREGEEGFTQILNSNDIEKAISDCPQAMNMISEPASKLKKQIKKEPAYFNKVFETYNQNCGK